MPSNLALSLHLFVQLGVVLLACWAFGLLLRRMGQPQVVADMVAGFLLGPTLFGFVLPGFQRWLFPATITLNPTTEVMHPSTVVLYVLGQLGLVLYMFVVGLTFRQDVFGKHLKSSFGAAGAGMLVPIITGGVLGWLLSTDGTFFSAKIASWQAALFVGAAMAITAFPMLARIIYENKLSGTPTGTVALACAAVDDTVAWILLALVVSAARSDPSVALLAVVGAFVYVGGALTLGRRLTRRLARTSMDLTGLRQSGLTLTLVLLFLCSAFTEATGLYAVVGAFVFGAVIPKGRFNEALREKIEPVTVRVLLPLFFIYSGLVTRFDLLLQPKILLVLIAVVVVAFVSKGLACAFGARSAGLPWKSAASVGALMNARGLMELILLNIGLDNGLVTPALYTVLALMTVLTTLASTPLYFLIQRRFRGRDAMAEIETEPAPDDDVERVVPAEI